MKHEKIVFIVGPTAVGKTFLGFLVAQKLQSEIISCDAMQVYQQVAIASNKPSEKMLSQVSHHLIDCVPLQEEFNVAMYEKQACQIIDNLLKKNKIPIIVGGSGMYMQVLLDGIFQGPEKNPEIRKQLELRMEREGLSVLFEELKRVDLVSAQRIHPNDGQRILRALEVYQTLKKPLSSVQKNRSGLWGNYDINIYALNCCREKLYERINQRVDEMFEQGLVDEVKALEDVALSQTASRIIGISEVKDYLKGEYDLEQAKYLMKLNTRHYAKRQLTWFRKDERIQWLNLEKDAFPELVERIVTDIDC